MPDISRNGAWASLASLHLHLNRCVFADDADATNGKVLGQQLSI
jgi:hypothetical protein